MLNACIQTPTRSARTAFTAALCIFVALLLGACGAPTVRTAPDSGDARADYTQGRYEQAALDEITQDEGEPNDENGAGRHEAGRHGNEAGAIGNALRAHVLDDPVGGWNAGGEQSKEHDALEGAPGGQCHLV